MRSQLKHDAESDMADFSSALLQAKSRGQKKNNSTSSYEDELQNLFDNAESFQQGGVENHNLSNELNNIRDDGPASARRTSVADAMRKKSRPVAHGVDNEGVVTDFSTTARAAVQNAQADTAAGESQYQTKPAVHKKSSSLNWQTVPVMLLLLITIILVVMQYRADARVAQLSAELETKTQGSLQTPSIQPIIPVALQNSAAQLDVALADINNKVKQLDDELAQIKSVQVYSEQSVAAAVKHELQSHTGARQNELESTNRSVAELRQVLSTVKQDVSALKSTPAVAQKTVATKKDSSNSRQPVAVPASSTTTKSKAASAMNKDNWQVNLAALSDRYKARKAYQKLHAAGVSPLIQEIDLDGKRMYRLSVEGFASRKAAQQFVDKAAKSYGFSAGWIRHAG